MGFIPLWKGSWNCFVSYKRPRPKLVIFIQILILVLLLLGPSWVYLVPEDCPWQMALQVAVALLSVVAGSAAFAASNLLIGSIEMSIKFLPSNFFNFS
jgi:hypothetical protein